MYEISEGNMLELCNVVSYRSTISRKDFDKEISDMFQFVSENNANCIGSPVTSTRSVDDSLMDVEILMPIDRNLDLSGKYIFKPIIKIYDAVKIRHCGKPENLENTADELIRYINERNLTPITPGYNVTVNIPSDFSDANDLIMDMYVGVSDNLL